MSGRQLFTIDKFRNTGKPLLSILAEPESVFMRGLRKFRRRTLYTNIVNDKSTVYYTTGISKTDPFANLGKIKPNYLKGYENVILDPRNPWSPLAKSLEPKTIGDFGTFAVQWLGRIPWILALVVFLPLGIVFFLVNSAVQSVRSWRRIRLHEEGRAGIPVDDYRGLPLLMDEVREAVEDAYEELNSSQTQEYLVQDGGSLDEDSGLDEQSHKILAIERKKSMPQEPTLALSPLQFKMIEALDRLTWRRYPVWIHKARHSHAAIIVRVEKPAFSEGWIVLKHWIKEEFIM